MFVGGLSVRLIQSVLRGAKLHSERGARGRMVYPPNRWGEPFALRTGLEAIL